MVELYLGEQEVGIPLLVTKNAVCSQTMKDGLVASLRQAIASRAVGHCLMHLNLEAVRQFFPRLGLE